jgi:8-oxo-dGTP pyrophosphatase MutT (NUDIX family)
MEVAVFVTRKSAAEVLILHRSAVQGGYWHVVAGGVEPGEPATAAAERELRDETGLVAKAEAGVEVVEYVYPLTEEPADRRKQYDPSVAQVSVTCFHVTAPDEWEPNLDWEHDDHRWCRARRGIQEPALASYRRGPPGAPNQGKLAASRQRHLAAERLAWASVRRRQ